MRMLWFKLRDAGSRVWSVYLVTDCVDDDAEGAARGPHLGMTHFDKREIEISIRQTWREMQNTVIHELMHAAAGTRRDKPWSRELEEAFIMRAERSMVRMAKQLGLTVPPLPRGVKLSPALTPNRKHA